MASNSELIKFIDESIQALSDSISKNDQNLIDVNITNITDLAVSLIWEHRTGVLRTTCVNLEQLYSFLLVENEQDRNDSTIGRVNGLLYLFYSAANIPDKEIIYSHTGVQLEIIKCLSKCTSMEDKIIAEHLKSDLETVEKSLTRLNNLGLVKRYREFKSKLNSLTALGQKVFVHLDKAKTKQVN